MEKKILVSIPLESGHIVITKIGAFEYQGAFVSIPLESGHIVIAAELKALLKEFFSFNPLRIGSYCNMLLRDLKEVAKATVSIPLESGHIVM